MDTRDSSLFNDVFKKATGFDPFAYQTTVALGRTDFHDLLKIPTGAGKTACVVIGWVWKRFFASQEVKKVTPRRLVYCLPRRVLVEQTYENVILWLDRLGLLSGRAQWETNDNEKRRLKSYDPLPKGATFAGGWAADKGVNSPPISVYILMGGNLEIDWDRYPENNAILIGTQDMLLSRALNRGYSMSRFRWPIHFGLLNNDSLWVMDEVQLMGSGLVSSVQLDAFRRKMGVFGICRTLWMSATCEPEWLETVDRDKPREQDVLRLNPEDLNEEVLLKRITAKKRLKKGVIILDDLSKQSLEYYIKALGEVVVECHRDSFSPGSPSLTLVIVNTVDRAQRLYADIKARKGHPDLRLIHSRFRPEERETLNRVLRESSGDPGFPQDGRILITTQVVEAGVDISARTLVTELAPWASLVQRFGRLNRYGEHKDSTAIWIDISAEDDKGNSALPYTPEELERSRGLLEQLEGISPEEVYRCKETFPYTPRYVLRRKDLSELFDNTPDLTGNDVDISRYVRDIRDLDVRVYWRNWGFNEDKPEAPPEELSRAMGTELCPVPLGSFREFLHKHGAWNWNYMDRGFEKTNPYQIFPGRVYLLHASDGGYTSEIGWYPNAKHHVEPVKIQEELMNESTGDDNYNVAGGWVTIGEHAKDVATELENILASLSIYGIDQRTRDSLLKAAWFHDIGKAHPVFQDAILSLVEDEKERSDRMKTLWAKSGGHGRFTYRRRYFRHELASALAVIQNRQIFSSNSTDEKDLVAYLVAAHHGKIRQSIRSLPNEDLPGSLDEASAPETRRFAHGIWEGDTLPQVNLDESHRMSETVLDLALMELGMHTDGDPPWLDVTTRLRDEDPGLLQVCGEFCLYVFS